MNKYICVHGHFYQPPRENAWLEEIEVQESARPFHDWNERISEECYGPNGTSRILNENLRIADITNNYARLSFNFGPTLLSWLENKRPRVYRNILEADRLSMKHFNGHGSAMAQVYNHVIMPLANRRDKETQVKWGIRDFEYRFKRKPEGMWLAETAVDLETLEVLAENDIKFTLLAPRQASCFRRVGDKEWTGGIDTRLPYFCKLPSGKQIVLFFYDGDRSQDVAFKGILDNGKEFAKNLLSGFQETEDKPQLVHIATDGESYGHHHKHGDMALAWCIRYIQENKLARITNYAEFLSLCPPEHEVEIFENSSWSCAHGVERWRSDCGCQTGGESNWNQQWRAPLRQALDHLRDKMIAIFEEKISPFHPDPWLLRDEYHKVILNRVETVQQQFLEDYIQQDLKEEQKIHIIRLLEAQKCALLMYTSCGWFFDELSGIEPVQILQYANRAIQLVESETDYQLEEEFLRLLAKAPSNLDRYPNGRAIYEELVSPKRLSLTQVGMHYAITSLFVDTVETLQVLNYECTSERYEKYSAGVQILAAGRTRVRSKVTLSLKHFSFVILYLGRHHIIGNAFDNMPEEEFDSTLEEIKAAFDQSNITKVIEMLGQVPDQRTFSFFDMFPDEQQKMLKKILDGSIDLAASSYRKIYNRTYPLMNVMRSLNLEVPAVLQKNLELVTEGAFSELFDESDSPINTSRLEIVISEAERWGYQPDPGYYEFLCSQKLVRLIYSLDPKTDPSPILDNIRLTLDLLAKIGVQPDLNEIQDVIFRLIKFERHFDWKPEVREKVHTFGEFVHLEVARIRKRNFRLA